MLDVATAKDLSLNYLSLLALGGSVCISEAKSEKSFRFA